MKSLKLDTKDIATIGILMGAHLIVSNFISINTPLIKISFGFVTLSIIGIIYGPLVTGIVAAICDIIGVALFPVGNFFFGFTITAFLVGCAYGFLKSYPLSIFRIILVVTFICVGLNIGLNTYWLSIIMGKAYVALLPARILKNLIMIPIQVAGILTISKMLNRSAKRLISRVIDDIYYENMVYNKGAKK